MTPFEKLKAPFAPASVSWRVGSTTKDKSKGLALAYIDARDVMERLDEAVGPENWQCDYPHAGSKTVCRIGVKIGDDWIWKSNGAGDSDVEAEKGALSDAFKRAAVMHGVGRYLYDLKNTWAELEPYGSSYKIKDSELRRLAGTLPKANEDAPPPIDYEVIATDLIQVIEQCSTSKELADLKASERFISEQNSLPEDQYKKLAVSYATKKAALMPKAA